MRPRASYHATLGKLFSFGLMILAAALLILGGGPSFASDEGGAPGSASIPDVQRLSFHHADHAYYQLPPGTAKGIVLLLHGMGHGDYDWAVTSTHECSSRIPHLPHTFTSIYRPAQVPPVIHRS